MNLFTKQKKTNKHRKQTYGYQNGKGVGEGKIRSLNQQIQTTIYKQMNNKVLLYSTENYIQCPVINHKGKEYEKEHIYLRITESLCYTSETNTTL